jgi:hypothetical protein
MALKTGARIDLRHGASALVVRGFVPSLEADALLERRSV